MKIGVENKKIIVDRKIVLYITNELKVGKYLDINSIPNG
jgi:hypothetical protein